MSTLLNWKQLSELQIEDVFEFFVGDSAYGVLSSIHPYSLTELRAEIQTLSAHDHYAFVDDHQQIECVVRLAQWDARSQNLQWMMDFQSIENTNFLSDSLLTLQTEIRKKNPHIRFYTYIFEHEESVKRMLKKMGFQQEAMIEDHVWVKGRYIGLEIWGTRRLGC